jgi:hypothetical protein
MSSLKTAAPNWRTARVLEKRRGVRMNSRVPVGVEWQNPEGETCKQQTFTCVVGSYGCLIMLPEDLPLEQPVRLVNLSNQQCIPGIVVWKGHPRPEGWELGIELSQPPMDFWGLEL